MDARGAVVAEPAMDQLDLHQQVSVGGRSSPGRFTRPLQPPVVAGGGNPQQPADDADPEFGIVGLLRLDVAEELYRSDRRAKKANAFPRISSSSSFLASSRSNRAMRAASDSPVGAARCRL